MNSTDIKPDRNGAIDLLRVAAMLAVALGHWLAVSLTISDSGNVTGRNALELAPQLSWITWILQVMPLFFAVGGYASALSFDRHQQKGGTGSGWVADRLRRMIWPAVTLALFWLIVLAGGAAAGISHITNAAAVAAAIPLWFVANYTIDIAIAPLLRSLFRLRPAFVGAAAAGTYGAVELASAAGVDHIHHINWVVGWLLFQIVGYAWHDGHIKPGRASAAAAVGLWAGAYLTVKFGPWPQSMIHIAGMTHSPTHPPSVALILFGLAYSLTAITISPLLNRALNQSSRLRRTVTQLGAVSMTVYLWHMTAATLIAGGQYATGLLSDTTPGTGRWWLEKIPFIAASIIALAAIIKAAGRFERAGLWHGKQGWQRSNAAIAAIAIAVSGSCKAWASGNVTVLTVGLLVLTAAAFGALNVNLRAKVDRAALKAMAAAS